MRSTHLEEVAAAEALMGAGAEEEGEVGCARS